MNSTSMNPENPFGWVVCQRDGMSAQLLKQAHDLRRVSNHTLEERHWTWAIGKVIDSAFSASIHSGMEISNQTALSLWDATVSPTLPKFQDIPVQKRLVEIVKLSRGAKLDSPCNLIGTYVPGMLVVLEVDSNPPQFPHILVSLVGELKVTPITYRNDKPVVVVDLDVFPELDGDPYYESISHVSYATSQGRRDRATVLQLDTYVKWRDCLAKAIVYLLSGQEYCGAYLAYAMVGTRFSRLLFMKNNILLECSRDFLGGQASKEVQLAAFLLDSANVAHLPWNLATPQTASPDNVLFNWHDGSVDALLAFTRLAHRILESHVLAAADGVSPLRPLVEPDLQHCPVLRSFLDEAIVDIQRSSCATAGNDPATIDCAIRESRVLPKQIQRRPPRKNKDKDKDEDDDKDNDNDNDNDNDKDNDKDEDTTDEDVDKKGDQHKDKKRVKKHAKHTPRGGSTRRQPSRAAKSHSSSTTQAAHNSHTTNIVTWATEVATEANNRAVDQSPDMPYELRTPPRDTVPVGGDTPGADLGRPLMEYLLEPGAVLKRRVTEMTTYTISGQVHAAADEYADVYGGDDVVSDAVDPEDVLPPSPDELLALIADLGHTIVLVPSDQFSTIVGEIEASLLTAAPP